VAAVHLPAAVLLDLPLVAAAAADGQPVWLDTAMAELEEVADAVGAAVKEGGRVLLFHGLATARARPDELNLRALVTLRERFGLPVGWQARDAAGAPATAAVALGATVVALPFDPAGTHGFDAAAFAAAAADAALVARALGDGDKRVQPSEWAERDRRHASLVARVDIARGTTLGAGMLATAPPGIGLTPRALAAVVGRQATVDIPAGTLITLGMLD
jgi:N-acetylneuraminate synthase/N,N'-diacetyllegionaminate synthase